MNPYSYSLLFLFAGSGPGLCEAPLSWKSFTGSCASCGHQIRSDNGIFCTNFLSERAHWAPYRKAWCTVCYTPLSRDPFPICRPIDDEGDEHMLPGDETRFVQACNGDHLITPFQCDLSHFRNVYKRDPKGSKGIDLLGL